MANMNYSEVELIINRRNLRFIRHVLSMESSKTEHGFETGKITCKSALRDEVIDIVAEQLDVSKDILAFKLDVAKKALNGEVIRSFEVYFGADGSCQKVFYAKAKEHKKPLDDITASSSWDNLRNELLKSVELPKQSFVEKVLDGIVVKSSVFFGF